MIHINNTPPGHFRGILFCTALAAVVMAMCAMSSPFYPMNTWDDVNCFSTMGRGLLQGKVLYRDLCEQKGPLLYFIYALCMGLFPRSYFGIFLMETACFSAFLYYSGKCAWLYLDKPWHVNILLPPLAVAVAASTAFAAGGSVEEMLLSPAAASLYMILRAVRKKEPIPGQDAFAIGLFASAAFWIKYTLCGLYVGLALFAALYHLACLRQAKRLLTVIGRFLLGLVPVTAAMLAYFAVHGALDDLYQTYFYDNIVLYSSVDGRGLFVKLCAIVWQIIRCIYTVLWHNRPFIGLALLGMLWFLTGGKERLWEALAAYLSFGCTVIFVYAGGVYYHYYGLYLASFSIFGLAALLRLVQRVAEKAAIRGRTSMGAALCAAVLTGSLLCAYWYGRQPYWRAEKSSLPQYQFASIIREKPVAILLNYGFLDGGFYYAADIVPDLKYFCRLNIALPEMRQEQDRYVQDGMADFVVVNDDSRGRFLEIMDGYSLAAENGGFYLYGRGG